MNAQSGTPLNAGIVGLGMAGAGIVNSLARLPMVRLAAAADLRENALAAFRDQFHGKVYQSFEGLCEDPDIDAVWVATPSPMHCEHAIALAEHGKHVIVEKPMATSLDECQRMIDAADRNNVVLIAGGARSFEPAFVEMQRILVSGRLGRLGALATWAFTTWAIRAREPHELDVNRGGGGIYNQAPHSIDVLRLLGGGMVRSVRGMTCQLLPEREGPAYFQAYLEFEDGTPASAMYNGYGYINGWEFTPWGETFQRQAASEAAYEYRRKLRAHEADEYAARETLRFGGRPAGGGSGGDGGWTPQDAGIVVASCERGEIRQSATGLYVYDDGGRHDEPLPPGTSMRLNEVTDLIDAISGRRRPLHDGRWGMATMEVVLGLIRSAAEHREIMMEHQVPVHGLE
jgi:phthalate 4,5-cis-dihydrodiol dehydrogenase